MMKSLSTILNIILIAAIIPLYVLYFTSGKDQDASPESTVKERIEREADGELPIAYINIDSVLSQMDMYSDVQEELVRKQQQLESTFSSRYRTFEQSVTRFQDEVSKGLLTRSEMQEKEMQLNNERLGLENLQNEYLGQMQEQEVVSQRRVIDFIMEYLKEYNADNKFEYIFSFSFGGNLLYVNPGNNITREVIVGINRKYAAEKAGRN